MTDEKRVGLYLRGDVWWIKYRGPRSDGSWGRIRESSGSSDPRAAAKLREERGREAKNDRDGIRRHVGARGRRVTVAALLDALEQHYETRKLKSLRQVKIHVAPVREFFGFKRATGINRRAIDLYIAKRRGEDVSDTTIDRETELLRRAFTLAAEDERPVVAWIPKIPRLVKPGENAREGFVERAEFEKLVGQLPAPVLQDVAWWAYATGMRDGEIRSLTWAGYDHETRTLRLPARSSKNNRPRLIVLKNWPELAAVIERRLADRRPGCPLIFHREGRRIGNFYTTWMRAVDRAEVRKFSIHDLRRTAARNMRRAGIDEPTAMLIMGHETNAMFKRYSITDERDLEEAMTERPGR